MHMTRVRITSIIPAPWGPSPAGEVLDEPWVGMEQFVEYIPGLEEGDIVEVESPPPGWHTEPIRILEKGNRSDKERKRSADQYAQWEAEMRMHERDLTAEGVEQ
jgi:hypothetical protein